MARPSKLRGFAPFKQWKKAHRKFDEKFSVGESVKVSGFISCQIVETFDHKCGVNSSIGESIHLSRYGGVSYGKIVEKFDQTLDVNYSVVESIYM
jgi:hypothetical protein